MKRSIFLLSMISAQWLMAQEQDSTRAESIELEGLTILEQLPISVEKYNKKTLNERNLGQDIPTLLNRGTSVLTSSDTGNGMGYSTIRIRGLGESSVNVTLNGVPLNNAESQGVFWVNMPDLASSTNAIYIQRGVGSSTNGMAAFGASVNIETQAPSRDPFLELAGSYGSFNSQKYTVQGGTGKILNDKFSIDVRASHLRSDGYIDRASSKLWSYDFTAVYEVNDRTSFRFQNMYGNEKTYQAWGGVTRAMMDENRRFNPSGAIYNQDWSKVIGYYDNQTDNYQQNHYFFTWTQKMGNDWKSNLTLHYTKGKGYYEDYKQDEKLSKYKMESLTQLKRTDLIRQKWLNNDFYGFNWEMENQRLGDFKLFWGVSANQYKGDHYGFVKWMKDFDWQLPDYKYYNNLATKSQVAAYAKVLYGLNNWEFYGDLQYRFIDYVGKYHAGGENDSDDFRPFDDQFNFINPKVGVNYKVNNQHSFYTYYGISNREPLRADYGANPTEKPKSEYLQDFELGYKKAGRLSVNLNGYYMLYKDQLVYTGTVNDVGTPLRKNIGKSYRAGVELDAQYAIIPERVSVFGNATWSKNINKDYKTTEYDVQGNEFVVAYGDTETILSPSWIAGAGFDVMPMKNFRINWYTKYVGEQYLSNTEPVDGQLASYLLTDLTLSYGLKLKGKQAIDFTFLINNLFDKEYESYGFYYGEAYYFPQAGINVMGGMKVRF